MDNFNEKAVFIKDSEGVMTYANDSFARLLRRNAAAELIGRRTADFFPAEAAAMLDKEDAEVMEKGVPYTIERKLKCADGQSRVFSFRKIPFTFGDAKFLFCFAEVAQPKSAQPASDSIPVSPEVRARFFSAISHDVRTPLNAIVGYAQVLRGANGQDQSREAAQAIEQGIPAQTILDEGLLAGMNVIGEKFIIGKAYVTEVMVAARAMNMGVALLKPLLGDGGSRIIGKVCIGTVEGDRHDIGKNIVAMMMESKGLEIIDLGTNVPASTFVDTAIEQGCDVICCSALLTTTMDVMGEVVSLASQAGIRDKVGIMIGGAPVTQEFCDQIGADSYTPDAASAADWAATYCLDKNKNA